MNAKTAAATLDFMGPLAFPSFTLERRIQAGHVTRSLRAGAIVSDRSFDEIYPPAVRYVSPIHWTPTGVCARIVELLHLKRGQCILDVGAGVGKFCIVAAAMSGAIVRGFERQPYLANVAREAAKRLGIDVAIVNKPFGATQDDVTTRELDAVYFFNPFTESLFLPGVGDFAMTGRVATERNQRAREDVAMAEKFMASARVGMRAVTFCGFGGVFPPSYERVVSEPFSGGLLEVWEKTHSKSVHRAPR
jgi:SAM-dependent methyltransferase